MASIHETLSDQFYDWEIRGRGWTVWPFPVSPEPAFRPFIGHFLPQAEPHDDGRRPTFLSSLVDKFSDLLRTSSPPTPHPPSEEEEEPEPRELFRDPLVEFQASLPTKFDIHQEACERLLRSLSNCREPVSFEILGTPGKIRVQFASGESDAPAVRRQLQAHFPEAVFQPGEGALEAAWESSESQEILVIEFGLEREFMFPLQSGKLDPFVGMVGALSDLEHAEIALFQVLFEPARAGWKESIIRSVTDEIGKPFFVNMPELAVAGENKVKRPLFAAVIRIAVKSPTYDRTVALARDIAGALTVFANPEGNCLVPLSNDDYSFEDHVEDMLRRQSRRSGMLLTSDEIIGFVHLPGSAVRSLELERDSGKSKAAPAIARNCEGMILGNNIHLGASTPVGLTMDQRVKHMHVIGASGTGKSTLLFNLIRQNIEAGEGVGVLDPHGDLVEQILGIIPPERVADVVLIDPSDEAYSVGFNILSAHSDLEKNLLASDLISVFERLSVSWGDQMGIVLQNAILAFLESERGGTLSDLRRFLIEPSYRNEFLATVRDPDIIYYWRKSFVQLSGNKSLGSVLTRLETFLAPKPIRYMVTQRENRIDCGDIMDTGKIFLAKLPQGEMGKENSFLLGSLLVSKFQQLAMGRQAQRIETRRPFFLYIDEFQNFITPSMAEILSGARKYRLGLVLAHQELHHLDRDRDVASAVLSNPYTRIVFRVGDADAKKLADGFSFFEARDLQNLETGQAICRVERANGDFNLSVPFPEPVPMEEGEARKQAVIDLSRSRYGKARSVIEAELRAKIEAEEELPPKESKKSASVANPAPDVKIPQSCAPPSKPTASLDSSQVPVQIPITVKKRLTQPQPQVAPKPPIPPDLGRGGTQHKLIQKRVKEAAQKLGFRVTTECPVLDGAGSVDLALERSASRIGVEITITTTIDHEIGNVTKCLQAGFPMVVLLAISEYRLTQLKEAVMAALGPENASRVSFFLPDAFISWLTAQSAPPAEVKTNEPVKRLGYTVKRSVSKISIEQRKQNEEAAIRSIAETMQKRNPSK